MALPRLDLLLGWRAISQWQPIRRQVSLNAISRTGHSTINTFTERTHHCGQLSKDDIGRRVDLFGWIKNTRFNNKILALRDSYGVTQCIVHQDKLTNEFKQLNIHNESVVHVSGIVRARPKGQENQAMSTGDIEVSADVVNVINNANKNLPILTRDDQESTLTNRLRYRYLDLRNHNMQEALRVRSKICQIIRDNLCRLNFIEIETPTLFKRTPGGANEFIVPTQTKDKFYSLTQSPQQLKQLLMVGGMDRYFQICRCYRDENGRPDRQPEFTQVDIELSFTNQQLIMKMINQLLYDLFSKLASDVESARHLLESFNCDNDIEIMSYQDVFDRYGSDKPDTRFAWLIEPYSDNSLAINVDHHLDAEFMSNLVKTVAEEKKQLDVLKFNVKLDNSGNISKVVINNNCPEAKEVLGALRLAIARELQNKGHQVYESEYKLLWVVDFPLFTCDKTSGILEPNHHPFTAPTADTTHLLDSNPLEVIGQHYDLVLNGQEVAGGSIRIHNAELQQRIFRDSLGLNDDTFDYFVEALRSGCPPHGGIAIGLDRLVAILLNKSSIREVIAFPKSSVGRDLMAECPHELDPDVKKLYHM